jgi:hypothetical protein
MTFSTKCRTALCVAAISALTTPAVPLAGAQDLRMPDTRDIAQGYAPGTTRSGWQDMRSPDTRDVAQGRNPNPSPVVSPGARSVPSYGGLDWASAALGAAVFGGLVLIGVVAAALVRRPRKHARVA